MKESKYELKNWKRWKHTLMLLNNTKEQLEIKKACLVNDDHSEIIEKINTLIDESRQYDKIIFYYKFFIERLEKSINDLLNKEEKICVLIYANNPDNASKREYSALEKGISRTAYYKILSNACNKLDKVLSPSVDQYDARKL